MISRSCPRVLAHCQTRNLRIMQTSNERAARFYCESANLDNESVEACLGKENLVHSASLSTSDRAHSNFRSEALLVWQGFERQRQKIRFNCFQFIKPGLVGYVGSTFPPRSFLKYKNQ